MLIAISRDEITFPSLSPEQEVIMKHSYLSRIAILLALGAGSSLGAGAVGSYNILGEVLRLILDLRRY